MVDFHGIVEHADQVELHVLTFNRWVWRAVGCIKVQREDFEIVLTLAPSDWRIGGLTQKADRQSLDHWSLQELLLILLQNLDEIFLSKWIEAMVGGHWRRRQHRREQLRSNHN